MEGEKRRIKEKGEGKGEEYDMEREGREEKHRLQNSSKCGFCFYYQLN